MAAVRISWLPPAGDAASNGGRRRGARRSYPPFERAVGRVRLTASSLRFVQRLASRRRPRLALAPLGHQVSLTAPRGLASGIANVVFAPGTGPALEFPPPDDWEPDFPEALADGASPSGQTPPSVPARRPRALRAADARMSSRRRSLTTFEGPPTPARENRAQSNRKAPSPSASRPAPEAAPPLRPQQERRAGSRRVLRRRAGLGAPITPPRDDPVPTETSPDLAPKERPPAPAGRRFQVRRADGNSRAALDASWEAREDHPGIEQKAREVGSQSPGSAARTGDGQEPPPPSPFPDPEVDGRRTTADMPVPETSIAHSRARLPQPGAEQPTAAEPSASLSTPPARTTGLVGRNATPSTPGRQASPGPEPRGKALPGGMRLAQPARDHRAEPSVDDVPPELPHAKRAVTEKGSLEPASPPRRKRTKGEVGRARDTSPPSQPAESIAGSPRVVGAARNAPPQARRSAPTSASARQRPPKVAAVEQEREAEEAPPTERAVVPVSPSRASAELRAVTAHPRLPTAGAPVRESAVTAASAPVEPRKQLKPQPPADTAPADRPQADAPTQPRVARSQRAAVRDDSPPRVSGTDRPGEPAVAVGPAEPQVVRSVERPAPHRVSRSVEAPLVADRPIGRLERQAPRTEPAAQRVVAQQSSSREDLRLEPPAVYGVGRPREPTVGSLEGPAARPLEHATPPVVAQRLPSPKHLRPGPPSIHAGGHGGEAAAGPAEPPVVRPPARPAPPRAQAVETRPAVSEPAVHAAKPQVGTPVERVAPGRTSRSAERPPVVAEPSVGPAEPRVVRPREHAAPPRASRSAEAAAVVAEAAGPQAARPPKRAAPPRASRPVEAAAAVAEPAARPLEDTPSPPAPRAAEAPLLAARPIGLQPKATAPPSASRGPTLDTRRHSGTAAPTERSLTSRSSLPPPAQAVGAPTSIGRPSSPEPPPVPLTLATPTARTAARDRSRSQPAPPRAPSSRQSGDRGSAPHRVAKASSVSAAPAQLARVPRAGRILEAQPAASQTPFLSAAAPSDHELDELAEKLYGRISTRLRGELRVDRERAGLVSDVR